MNKFLLAIIALLLTGTVKGQDIIYTKREGTIPAKVVDVTPSLIRFKKAENINGPNYTIANRFVDSIVYENGTRDIFSIRGIKLSPKAQKEWDKFGNLPGNTVWAGLKLMHYDLPNIILEDGEDQPPVTAMYIGYERFFFRQKLSGAVSAFAGFNKEYYGFSLSAKFYPKSTGRGRIGLGPLLTHSFQDWQFSHYTTDGSYGRFTSFSKSAVTSLAFNLSLLANINRNLVLSSDFYFGGLTGVKNIEKNFLSNYTSHHVSGEPVLGFRFGLGYRF